MAVQVVSFQFTPLQASLQDAEFQRGITAMRRNESVSVKLGNITLTQKQGILVFESPSFTQVVPPSLRNSVLDRLEIRAPTRIAGLPRDIQLSLLEVLPYETILQTCSAVSELRNICSASDEATQRFWEGLAQKQLGVSQQEFRRPILKLTPAERYLQLYTYYSDRCAPGSEEYAPADVCLVRSAEANESSRSTYFVDLLKTDHDIVKYYADRIASELLRSGDLENFRRWGSTLEMISVAAEQNRTDIIESLIPKLKGDTERAQAYGYLLLAAIRSENWDLAKRTYTTLQSLPAQLPDRLATQISVAAARKGNLEYYLAFRTGYSIEAVVVALLSGSPELLAQFGSVSQTVVLTAIERAVREGDIVLVRSMLSRLSRALRDDELTDIYITAARNNHFDIIRTLVSEGSIGIPSPEWMQSVLRRVANDEHLDLFKELLTQNPQDNEFLTELFGAAVETYDYRTARYLSQYNIDLNAQLLRFAGEGKIYGVKFLLSLGADDLAGAIKEARQGAFQTAQYLRELQGSV